MKNADLWSIVYGGHQGRKVHMNSAFIYTLTTTSKYYNCVFL